VSTRRPAAWSGAAWETGSGGRGVGAQGGPREGAGGALGSQKEVEALRLRVDEAAGSLERERVERQALEAEASALKEGLAKVQEELSQSRTEVEALIARLGESAGSLDRERDERRALEAEAEMLKEGLAKAGKSSRAYGKRSRS